MISITLRLILLPYFGALRGLLSVCSSRPFSGFTPGNRDAKHVGVKAEIGVATERLLMSDAKGSHVSAQAPVTRSC